MARKSKKEVEVEFPEGHVPHVVTEGDLENNPELAGELDLQVGEIIGIPVEDTEVSGEPVRLRGRLVTSHKEVEVNGRQFIEVSLEDGTTEHVTLEDWLKLLA